MIIFDLDGTLANCEHRRHLVDPEKDDNLSFEHDEVDSHGIPLTEKGKWCCGKTGKLWKPNWDAFYEACDKDAPNDAVIDVFHALCGMNYEIEIWSGRSEAVRQKTIDWLFEKADLGYCGRINLSQDLKMRPVGDSTPDDVLKEKWLDEAIAQGKKVEMVFDDRNKVVKMWRRREIPCFQVADGDF